MKTFKCPLCKKTDMMVESNLTLVTKTDHDPQKAKQAFFHQYICPDCGFVALTKPFEEGEEPESIIS